MLNFPQIFVAIGSAYLMTGLAIAVVFLIFWIDRLDAGSHGAFAFRPLLIPALVLLWPVVIMKTIRNDAHLREVTLRRGHKRAHRWIWIFLAIVIVGVLVLAWRQRVSSPPPNPSIRLSSVSVSKIKIAQSLADHPTDEVRS